MNADDIKAYRAQIALFRDPLPGLVLEGARKLIAQAVELEFSVFLEKHQHLRDDNGRKRIIRNGYLPDRYFKTMVGNILIQIPKSKDHKSNAERKIRFRSSLLPPYMRKTQHQSECITCLYLRGVTTGDFRYALSALIGRPMDSISPPIVSRLTESWARENEAWCKRSFSSSRYCVIRASCVPLHVGAVQQASCTLVLIGTTEDRRSEFIAAAHDRQDTLESWGGLLSEVKERGLQSPQLAIGDESLAFWDALTRIFHGTWRQYRVRKMCDEDSGRIQQRHGGEQYNLQILSPHSLLFQNAERANGLGRLGVSKYKNATRLERYAPLEAISAAGLKI